MNKQGTKSDLQNSINISPTVDQNGCYIGVTIQWCFMKWSLCISSESIYTYGVFCSKVHRGLHSVILWMLTSS